MIVLVFVSVGFYTRANRPDKGMGVWMDVDAAVVEGSTPGMMIDEDGVSTPGEACAVPAESAVGRADGDGRTEADGAADEEAGTWREEDDAGAIDGHVVECRVDGLDLEVSAVVDDIVV